MSYTIIIMAYTIIQTYDPLGALSTLKENDICSNQLWYVR